MISSDICLSGGERLVKRNLSRVVITLRKVLFG